MFNDSCLGGENAWIVCFLSSGMRLEAGIGLGQLVFVLVHFLNANGALPFIFIKNQRTHPTK